MLLPEEPKFLHFQDLVDQARKSIVTYCPEWTDYNLSDPGITLIEIFAWMTTQLNYRLNQVPQKNYLKFLELLGALPKPPQPARTQLTFYLSTPFPLIRANGQFDDAISTRIPAHTEVATRRATGTEEEIIFTTEIERDLKPPRLVHVRRTLARPDGEEQFSHNYLTRRPGNEGDVYEFARRGFHPFQEEAPHEGDAFYLGFDETQDLAGYFVRLDFECPEIGVGVTPDNPPLVWEYSLSDSGDEWGRVMPEEDTTKALTRNGWIKLHLPLDLKPAQVRGVNASWLRCRLKVEDEENQKKYTKSPRINDLKAFVLGLTVPAIHSQPIPGEELGESNGDPGQKFYLSRAPILPLQPERSEAVEVAEERLDGSLEFRRWQQVQNFSQSGRYDLHFTLDTGSGEVCFGPGIRQPNGEVRQCGAVPKLGRKIRLSRYRIGGGIEGNVPAGSLRVLKQPISYIVEVANRVPAVGGEDPESLEAAKLRAQETLQGRQRAVTAEDYEYVCQNFGYLARVKCIEPSAGQLALRPGTVKLLVVPKPGRRQENTPSNQVSPTERKKRQETAGETSALTLLAELQVDPLLREKLKQDLEPYRILGITLDIAEPVYLGVKIEANVQRKRYNDTKEVREKVVQALQRFITPLTLAEEEKQADESPGVERTNGKAQEPLISPAWQWPFGRNLYISDVYAKIQAVEEVEHVTGVKLAWSRLTPGPEAAATLTWKQASDGVIPVPSDGLLCFLDDTGIEVTGYE